MLLGKERAPIGLTVTSNREWCNSEADSSGTYRMNIADAIEAVLFPEVSFRSSCHSLHRFLGIACRRPRNCCAPTNADLLRLFCALPDIPDGLYLLIEFAHDDVSVLIRFLSQSAVAPPTPLQRRSGPGIVLT